ncbi:MAG: hypothetical protein Q7S10_03265 [bacterium]|nr:hypothetical protein [bacterium]
MTRKTIAKKKVAEKTEKETTVKDVLVKFMDQQFPRIPRKITSEEYECFIRVACLPSNSRFVVMTALKAWNELHDCSGYDG